MMKKRNKTLLEIILMACVMGLTFSFLEIHLWWWAPKIDTIITTLDALLKFLFSMLESIFLARSGEETIINELNIRITPAIIRGEFGYIITELYPQNKYTMTVTINSPSVFGLSAVIVFIVLFRFFS